MSTKDYSAELLKMEGVQIEKLDETEEEIILQISMERKMHICKRCGGKTDQIHDYRVREVRDLELRGAGNLLGPQQSGHLANIGYDLYCKLLEEAVLEAQGEAPKLNRDIETRMDVHVNAYLPNGYVTGDKQRLEVYKRIASITTAAQRDDVEEELVDRFGDEPLCVANLVAVAYLKAMCSKLGIDRAAQVDGRIDMRFAANAQVDGQKLFKALTGFDKRLTLNAALPVTLTLKDPTLNREDLLMLCVKVMERLLDRMDLSAA